LFDCLLGLMRLFFLETEKVNLVPLNCLFLFRNDFYGLFCVAVGAFGRPG